MQSVLQCQDYAKLDKLVRFLIENIDKLCDGPPSEVTKFLDHVTALPLLSVFNPGVRVSYDVTVRYRTVDVAVAQRIYVRGTNLSNLGLIWSRVPLFDCQFYVTKEARTLLRMRETTCDDVLSHILFVSCLNGPLPAIFSGSLLDDAYCYLRNCGEEDFPLIRARLSEARCLQIGDDDKNPVFVSGTQVFQRLAVLDIPPFAYHVSSLHRGLRGASDALFDALGVRKMPMAEDIFGWLAELSAQMSRNGQDVGPKSDALSKEQLRIYINLLTLLADCDVALSVLARCYGPDKKNILRPLSQLFIDDAPWLTARLSPGSIHIVHEELLPLASKLNILSLAGAVEELLDENRPLCQVDVVPPELTRWEHMLRSLAFRRGVLQLLFHEAKVEARGFESRRQPFTNAASGGMLTQSGDHQSDKLHRGGGPGISSAFSPQAAVLSRVHLLGGLHIVPVQELASRFVLKSSGEDITGKSVGSSALVQQTSQGGFLYLVTSIAKFKWLPLLAVALNRFLHGALRNLQPLEKMLDLDDAGAIPEVLDMLQISTSALDLDDVLGTPVDSSALFRLRAPPSSELPVGSDVAWQADENGGWYFGRVTGCALADDSVPVLVGRDQQRVFPRTDLRIIASVEALQVY